MKLDTVHDVQGAYRRVVTAMSYPGTVVSVTDFAARVDLDSALPRPLLLLSVMLLDAEVSFCLIAPGRDAESRILSQLTYSRAAAAENAAFLLVDTGTGSPEASTHGETDQAIAAARVGTLESPHLGATVVLRVEGLCEEPTGSRQGEHVLRLEGPGIATRRALGVRGSVGWTEVRREKNREYPLGIDMILYTDGGSVAALPRTTKIVEVREWDM